MIEKIKKYYLKSFEIYTFINRYFLVIKNFNASMVNSKTYL